MPQFGIIKVTVLFSGQAAGGIGFLAFLPLLSEQPTPRHTEWE